MRWDEMRGKDKKTQGKTREDKKGREKTRLDKTRQDAKTKGKAKGLDPWSRDVKATQFQWRTNKRISISWKLEPIVRKLKMYYIVRTSNYKINQRRAQKSFNLLSFLRLFHYHSRVCSVNFDNRSFTKESWYLIYIWYIFDIYICPVFPIMLIIHWFNEINHCSCSLCLIAFSRSRP